MNRVNVTGDTPKPETLLDAVVRHALQTVGVEEQPRGSNDGPEVRAWLARVRITKPSAWCAAWLCSMFGDAAADLEMASPCPMVAGALRLWEKAPLSCRITARAAREQPVARWRGLVFVEDHGHGLGHVGLVLGPPDERGIIQSIEGNTVPKGQRSRNGFAVARQEFPISDVRLVGFLDFSR